MSLKSVKSISDLTRGTIVRHKSSGNSYVVVDSYSHTSAIAVRSVHISNPSEWLIFEPDNQDSDVEVQNLCIHGVDLRKEYCDQGQCLTWQRKHAPHLVPKAYGGTRSSALPDNGAQGKEVMT